LEEQPGWLAPVAEYLNPRAPDEAFDLARTVVQAVGETVKTTRQNSLTDISSKVIAVLRKQDESLNWVLDRLPAAIAAYFLYSDSDYFVEFALGEERLEVTLGLENLEKQDIDALIAAAVVTNVRVRSKNRRVAGSRAVTPAEITGRARNAA
jgi:hypothetical protein